MAQQQLTHAKERRALRLTEFDTKFETFVRKHNVSQETISEILSLDVNKLIQRQCSENRFKAVELLIAYVSKSKSVNDEFNCIQYFFPESLDIAEQLDQDNKDDLPLFGIPFSVKANFHMPGYPSDCGLVKKWNQLETKKNSFVEHLESLGGIPFCHTTVPQALISYVCTSPIYGTTKNPHNPKCSPGGSTGGDACLVALGGTPFGTGSDLAGSLRIPSSFCGISSMKPCERTLISFNSNQGMPGKSRIALSYGFLTKHAYEQEILWRIFFKDDSYQIKVPLTIPGGIRFSEFRKPKKVGFFKTTGFVDPVPSNRRALEDVLKALEEDGCQLYEFKLPPGNFIAHLAFNSVISDNGDYLWENYKGEIVDEYLKQFHLLLSLPTIVKRIGSFFLQWISPQLQILASTGNLDVVELRNIQADIDDMTKKFIYQFQENEIDFIVCPQFAVPAVPHKYPQNLAACAIDTVLWNLCDFPAGVVTTDKVNDQDIEDLDKEHDKRSWNIVVNTIYEASKETLGNPIGVQCVALPYQEGKLLKFMTYIEKLMRKNN
uniref:Amidase domain-containing protein n=1 Tax=Parastrongyloides trichosuri TaxID=131310 RepID=A0A0N5A443_PARTI